MRKLPAAAQEERRRQVIGLRRSGLTYEAIGQQVGLTRNGVFGICQRFAQAGMAGLRSGRRGPPPGTGRFLTPAQERDIQHVVRTCMPDDLGLPYALGSRAAVGALIAQRCKVRLAERTVGTYLARWRFTAQKPLRRAYEQRPAEVRRWLRQDYPVIAARARREHAAIFWGDETGLRGDDVRGRCYAPRGRTPTVRPCHKRAGLGLISALTNKGELRWMVLERAITAPLLIGFLHRLIRDAGRKVFLILDNLRMHRARAVQDWLADHTAGIEVVHLPAYSPELNPDEGLHADLKQAVHRKPPARSKQELRRSVVGHMRKLSRRPGRIRSFFQQQPVQYAA